jgi:hypothetical protein
MLMSTKKSVAAAMLFAAATLPAAAADRNCFTGADLEAEHALVLQSNVMVLSSACNQDVMYGEFKVRNRDALIAYQHAMIDHFRRTGRGSAERAFETWFTHIANQAAIQHAGLPSPQTCVQTVAMLKFDPKSMHDYLVAHAADPVDGEPTCGAERAVHRVKVGPRAAGKAHQ